LKDASRSARTIERWFSRVPVENIGVVAGPSGLVILDVDPRNGGDESLARLLNDGREMPQTLCATTGGGGQHFVFSDTARLARKRVLSDGLDVVAGPAYFIVAPSGHASGRSYTWDDADAPVAPAPAWLFGE
jgi:hypothetical protein